MFQLYQLQQFQSYLTQKKFLLFCSTKITTENWSSISKINSENYKFHFKNDAKSFGVFSFPCTGRLIAEKMHLKNSIDEIELNKKADILSLAKILI